MRKIDGKFVLCVNNVDCEDLELRKIYRVVSDKKAEKENFLRVVDESGEDYLYPDSHFVKLQIPEQAINAILKAG